MRTKNTRKPVHSRRDQERPAALAPPYGWATGVITAYPCHDGYLGRLASRTNISKCCSSSPNPQWSWSEQQLMQMSIRKPLSVFRYQQIDGVSLIRVPWQPHPPTFGRRDAHAPITAPRVSKGPDMAIINIQSALPQPSHRRIVATHNRLLTRAAQFTPGRSPLSAPLTAPYPRPSVIRGAPLLSPK